jgi:hypothetical protein
VQGQLRNEQIDFTIQTECACCGKKIRFEMDSDLNYRIAGVEEGLLIFAPIVDFDKLEDPSIIDAF